MQNKVVNGSEFDQIRDGQMTIKRKEGRQTQWKQFNTSIHLCEADLQYNKGSYPRLDNTLLGASNLDSERLAEERYTRVRRRQTWLLDR